MSIVNRTSVLRVIALEINEDGAVSKKQMKIDRDSQLENTLLKADYPDIRVATIDIPQQQLDQYQQAMVEHSLSKRIAYDGVEYILVGASASAKNGKYYAVDAAHAKTIAQRFRFWPEAAMTYFGILVSPCKVCIEIPDARVVVVRDHELGTNDCRGWIRRSYFERLHLADRHFYQFRMSFENTQAKGSFKIMEDDVADALSVDFIIPRSSCKPEFKKPECVRQCPNRCRPHQRAVFHRPGGDRDSGDLTGPPVLVQLHPRRTRSPELHRDRNQADCHGRGRESENRDRQQRLHRTVSHPGNFRGSGTVALR